MSGELELMGDGATPRGLVLEAVRQGVANGTISRAKAYSVRVISVLAVRRFNEAAVVLVSELENDVPSFGSLNGLAVGGSLAERVKALGGYEFDPDNFERFLQMLIEYLPQLIDILLSLLAKS